MVTGRIANTGIVDRECVAVALPGGLEVCDWWAECFEQALVAFGNTSVGDQETKALITIPRGWMTCDGWATFDAQRTRQNQGLIL